MSHHTPARSCGMTHATQTRYDRNHVNEKHRQMPIRNTATHVCGIACRNTSLSSDSTAQRLGACHVRQRGAVQPKRTRRETLPRRPWAVVALWTSTIQRVEPTTARMWPARPCRPCTCSRHQGQVWPTCRRNRSLRLPTPAAKPSSVCGWIRGRGLRGRTLGSRLHGHRIGIGFGWGSGLAGDQVRRLRIGVGRRLGLAPGSRRDHAGITLGSR